MTVRPPGSTAAIEQAMNTYSDLHEVAVLLEVAHRIIWMTEGEEGPTPRMQALLLQVDTLLERVQEVSGALDQLIEPGAAHPQRPEPIH